jgi:DNA-directed RNA polymerase III subunit RPC1
VGTQDTTCTTCHHQLQHCVGHFGHTHIELPIYHIGYFKHLILILKMVCKSCSRILLPENTLTKYISKMKKIQHQYMDRLAFFKKVFKEASKNKICAHCGSLNPTIQKIPKVAGKIEVKCPTMYTVLYLSKMQIL